MLVRFPRLGVILPTRGNPPLPVVPAGGTGSRRVQGEKVGNNIVVLSVGLFQVVGDTLQQLGKRRKDNPAQPFGVFPVFVIVHANREFVVFYGRACIKHQGARVVALIRKRNALRGEIGVKVRP